MKWHLIFTVEGCTETQIFLALGNPQEAAITIIKEYPFLRLIAAVEGAARIFPMDNARTAECGLAGWPEL
jgi:hypothetical protein